MGTDSLQITAAEPREAETWPAEADFILSALEAANDAESERRKLRRMRYRVCAQLRLFIDTPDNPSWVLYSRDVNERGMGFITPHRLPLGYGGKLQLRDPQGNVRIVECTLLRCREASPGWYEGALYFNRQQWSFSPEDNLQPDDSD